jgi:hypothetical protein
MERHPNIPERAAWSQEYNEWRIGPNNSAGEPTGLWEEWHPKGYLIGTIDYGNGTPPFTTRRFHPDGSLAQEGSWYGGKTWLGTVRHINSDAPTDAAFPRRNTPGVWSIEYDYVAKNTISSQRFYDKEHHPVGSKGTPLPERPATVPASAWFIDLHDSDFDVPHWVTGTLNMSTGTFLGESCRWDMNGNLMQRQLNDATTGAPAELHRYLHGKLTHSNYYKDDKEFHHTFYPHLPTPVISETLIYHTIGSGDQEKLFFDETGRQVFSVRKIVVYEVSEQRYYNDQLVYEQIKQPFSVRYFYPDGNTLIGYSERTWQLFDEQGQTVHKFPEAEEERRHSRKTWDGLLPTWEEYELTDDHQSDFDTARANFELAYEYRCINDRLLELEYLPHLYTELEKVDWYNIGSRTRNGGAILPGEINGLLSDDEDMASICAHFIWNEIAYNNAWYESTTHVAITLARMLPYYPTPGRTFFQQIYKLLKHPHISDEEELYAELQPSLPLLLQLAAGEDVEMARWAQFILLCIDKEQIETGALLLHEWQDHTHSPVRRGYAAFTLAKLYTPENLIISFTPAFNSETDPFVRLILALNLVSAAGTAADEAWINYLLDAFNDGIELNEDFQYMDPFGKYMDIWEYILALLPAHTIQIIASLPALPREQQTPLFTAICSVLLNEDAFIEMELITREALLAIADVVEEDPDFFDRNGELFWKHNIPQHAHKIRELANAKENIYQAANRIEVIGNAMNTSIDQFTHKDK